MKQRNSIVAVAVVLLAGVAAGVWWWTKDDSGSTVVTGSDGNPIRFSTSTPLNSATTRPVFTERNLDEKEQQAVMQSAHLAMRDRLRAYSKMSPEEQRKHLDEQIDQQEKMRKEGGLKIEAATRPTGDGGNETKVTESADGTQKSVIVRRSINDKEAVEGMDPELRALLAQYAGDMRKRRAERGLPDSPGMVFIRQETRVGEPK
jgi:hypothetical protein